MRYLGLSMSIAAWLLLMMLFACHPSMQCLQNVCGQKCREADEAWQNDVVKNAICTECVRECTRSE